METVEFEPSLYFAISGPEMGDSLVLFFQDSIVSVKFNK